MTQAEGRETLHRGDAELVRVQENTRALPASLEKTARLARGYFEVARAENTTAYL